MAKTTDFGGLPSTTFTEILATFSTPGGAIADADKIKVLATLAKEEHAGASCGDFNVVEAVILILKIQQQHTDITGGSTSGTAISDFITSVDKLGAFWKS